MSDLYRDRVRHGGILSNTFICKWRSYLFRLSTDALPTAWWWNRQVVSNQYGLPGRAARNWGPDTIEGNLCAGELEANREDQTIDTAKYAYRDDEYYKTKDFELEDIEVPLLSVANWVCSCKGVLIILLMLHAGRYSSASSRQCHRLYESRFQSQILEVHNRKT